MATVPYEMSNIILRLRLRRIELGLKQEYVARKLHKYASYISKIEHRERKLSLEEFLELAKVYKKDPCYFL